LVVRPDNRGNAWQHKSDVTTEPVCNAIGDVGETFQAPSRWRYALIWADPGNAGRHVKHRGRPVIRAGRRQAHVM